jgi:transcription elongation factor GreA
MAADMIPFTTAGYKRLKDELEHLKSFERPKIISEIAEARSHGDLKENAEYHAAREKQSFIEGRIQMLEDQIARANVLDLTGDASGVVKFGAHVSVVDEESGEEKTYHIVGDLEADINENRISMGSPLSKSLMGRREGDTLEVRVPKGIKEYSITKVEYR